MLPSDLLGATIFSTSREEFDFKPGPIFSNILLADEINRTTPKTQSALLEAMNEGQVSIEGRSYPLPDPFLVIATQNPIEYHGTFPLPEAQLDRFLLRIEIGYPDAEAEREILRMGGGGPSAESIQPALTGGEITDLQRLALDVTIHDDVVDYLLALVQATRDHQHLTLGISPRGSLALSRAAQAMALVEGQDYVTPHHVKMLARAVLPHRLIADRRFGADVGVNERTKQILEEILQSVPAPV